MPRRASRQRLPPLNALRAFEAAARHESFSQAAEELHVIHSAVSHQVKALESWLGVELFERSARSVKLGALGRVYHDTNLVYGAAIAGQGVGQLHTALTRDELAAGQLVRPFAVGPGDDLGYHIVRAPSAVRDPRVAEFCDWLLAEAREAPAGA